MRRGLGPALLLVLVAVVAAGCSGSSDGAPASTAAPTTTTTTKPEITDEQIIDNINAKLRPSLEDAFDAATVDCVIGVLEDGGTGELNADEVVPAYQSRCEVSASEVTAVITAGALVQAGATADQGACVRTAVSKLTYEQISALDETTTNQLYEACGIDPEALAEG